MELHSRRKIVQIGDNQSQLTVIPKVLPAEKYIHAHTRADTLGQNSRAHSIFMRALAVADVRALVQLCPKIEPVLQNIVPSDSPYFSMKKVQRKALYPM